MGILIDTDDFQNEELYAKYYIPFNSNLCGSEEQLEGYISRYEKRYINELLGVELAKLFIADLEPNSKEPQSPIYQAIYYPIEEDLPKGTIQYYGYYAEIVTGKHLITH